jgi:hypothetical protein
MNEQVDTDGVIEVSHTSHTKKTDGGLSDEEEMVERSAEDMKKHESIINDVYNSMSDSEEEEED